MFSSGSGTGLGSERTRSAARSTALPSELPAERITATTPTSTASATTPSASGQTLRAPGCKGATAEGVRCWAVACSVPLRISPDTESGGIGGGSGRQSSTCSRNFLLGGAVRPSAFASSGKSQRIHSPTSRAEKPGTSLWRNCESSSLKAPALLKRSSRFVFRARSHSSASWCGTSGLSSSSCGCSPLSSMRKTTCSWPS